MIFYLILNLYQTADYTMTAARIIETMGSITKVEKLETLEGSILENTLVLEEVEPYPGYHGANLPSGYNPTAVYLTIREKLPAINIIRITQKIRKQAKKMRQTQKVP